MQEPIRWVQTNLRETDAGLDAARLVAQLAEMRANVLLMGMGGIAAYYPTRWNSTIRAPNCRRAATCSAMSCGKRTRARFAWWADIDFSKTRKAVFDAHPEWFFRQANGKPVIYNGLYSTCINGGYYREQAMKILTEGLEQLRRGRPVLQHVRQPVDATTAAPSGPVPLRCVPAPISEVMAKRFRTRRMTSTASSCAVVARGGRRRSAI